MKGLQPIAAPFSGLLKVGVVGLRVQAVKSFEGVTLITSAR